MTGDAIIDNHARRRRLLKLGGATIALAAIVVIPNRTDAAVNAALRAALKYQGKPEGDKNCANCVQFVPGASAKEPGGCKVIPNDTEISPQGYCVAWAKKV